MSCASRLLSAFSGVQVVVSEAGRGCGVAESSDWAVALDMVGVDGAGGPADVDGATDCGSLWR